MLWIYDHLDLETLGFGPIMPKIPPRTLNQIVLGIAKATKHSWTCIMNLLGYTWNVNSTSVR